MVTNVIEKGEEFSVDMKIHFHETIQEPIFAFTIKDLKGTEITGTNTMYENTPVGTQKAGETRRITFTQKMPLEAGEYMLCLGCTGYRDGDFTVFHRLYDVCNLTVITDKKAVGYFDLFSKVTLK
jgi:lipopolysaccharide transport system ATP-binding protein